MTTKIDKMMTLDEFEENYLRNHPHEIDAYLKLTFEELAKDKDLNTALATLRVIAKVKGMGETAKQIGMTRQGLQKALSPNGNPTLSTFRNILESFGYRLSVEKIVGE